MRPPASRGDAPGVDDHHVTRGSDSTHGTALEQAHRRAYRAVAGPMMMFEISRTKILAPTRRNPAYVSHRSPPPALRLILFKHSFDESGSGFMRCFTLLFSAGAHRGTAADPLARRAAEMPLPRGTQNTGTARFLMGPAISSAAIVLTQKPGRGRVQRDRCGWPNRGCRWHRSFGATGFRHWRGTPQQQRQGERDQHQ